MDLIRLNYAVIFVILLCALANGGSEGKRWKPEDFVQNKSAFSSTHHIEVNKAELVLMHCKEDLIKRSNAVEGFDLHSLAGSIDMRSVILRRKNLHNTIKFLPPHVKRNLLDCTGKRSLTVPVSEEESRHLLEYSETLFDQPSSCRRYLASESPPTLQPPAGIAYVAIAAVVLFLIVGFLFCFHKDNSKKAEPKVGHKDNSKKVEPKVEQKYESSFLNLSCFSAGSQSSVCLEDSVRKESAFNIVKKPSVIRNLCTNPEDPKSSLAETISSDVMAQVPSPPMKPPLGKLALAPPRLPPPPPLSTTPPPTLQPPPLPLPPSPPPSSLTTKKLPTSVLPPSAPPACPPAPHPPTPPRIAQPPPLPQKPIAGKFQPPPLGPPGHRQGDSSEGVESGPPKPKLKPFFWDKVLAKPGQAMVWHEIRAGSFQFNEEIIESLFGCANQNQNEHKKEPSSLEPTIQFIQIIDHKKAQNLSILLRALNVTTAEVVDALEEGNEIPVELIQTLLKMAPSMDEELKLRSFTGELSELGPAERFLKVIVDIPFAFKRLESLLFMITFSEETQSIKESFANLEVASNKLRNSRLFLKLLEAVLKTGNRMNDGTYRGGALAFKLDTLLKLSDVKGSDGKTTLLHFVVQEIIRSEGVRAARAEKESQSQSSVKTDEFFEDASEESAEHCLNLGLKVVSGLSDELEDVKKAAVMDGDMLKTTVSKLNQTMTSTKEFLNTDMKNLDEDSGFYDNVASFVDKAEGEIRWLSQEEKRIMALVKSTADYFHGNSGKDEGLRLFVIVRDFLIILDKVCKEVKDTAGITVKVPKKEVTSASSSPDIRPTPPSPAIHPTPTLSSLDIRPTPADMRSKLFPAILGRRTDGSSSDSSSDDDES